MNPVSNDPSNATDAVLAVILVSYNSEAVMERCLQALYRALEGIPAQVVVVDNASQAGAPRWILDRYPSIRLIENATNVGFGRANNVAIHHVNAPLVLLLNTDAFITPDAIAKSLAFMAQHPDCGIMGARLIGEDGSLQPSARYFPTLANVFLHRTGLSRLFPRVQRIDDFDWPHDTTRECDWVPGCYYLVRKSVIDEVGLFDPRYFLYYEEVDHCLAAKRAGWKVMYFPGTSVVHLGGESAKSVSKLSSQGRQIEHLQIESELLYFRKNFGPAAVWLHVLLLALGHSINVAKRLVRLRRPLELRQRARQWALVWRLFRATDFARNPTR